MNITMRDVQLLRYLHAVKVATYKQIHRDLYPEYHPRSVCNRAVKLEEQGLVTGIQNRLFAKGERILSISKLGFQKFIATEEELRCEFKSEAIAHDLQLVDIRYRFMKLAKFSKYLTENEIQTWGLGSHGVGSPKLMQLNCDALARVRFGESEIWVVIEYEDSEKAAQRYQPIVRKYYLCEEVAAVFYVCKSENTIRKISQVERELFPSDQPKFFYQTAAQLTLGDAICFRNYNNFSLNFEQKKGNEQLMIS